MSMKINEDYKDYKSYLEQEKTREIRKTQQAEETSNKNQTQAPKDEYVSSKESDNKSSGLYKLGKDEQGKPKILFDDPKKEKCTTDTDNVDREIKSLKNEKMQLQQKIAKTKDLKKVKELEKKLARVESELSQKDNDTYRRQNASVSSSSV